MTYMYIIFKCIQVCIQVYSSVFWGMLIQLLYGLEQTLPNRENVIERDWYDYVWSLLSKGTYPDSCHSTSIETRSLYSPSFLSLLFGRPKIL